MARLVKAWPCLMSALLINLAYPPFNLGLLVLAGLVPWLLSLRESTLKEGFRSGWTFGFLLMLGQLSFLFMFVNRWIDNPILAFVPFAFGCAFVALFYGLLGSLVSLCWKHKMPWAIPLVWAGVEVMRSYVPGFAFPYGLLASPLWPYPWLIQSAYYGSIFMIGAWAALVNMLICHLVAGGSNWRHLRGYVAGIVLILLFGWMRYSEPMPIGRAMVTVGQPGTDLAFGTQEANDAKLQVAVAEFFAKALMNGSELLVLPEGIAGRGGEFPPKPIFDVPNGVPVIFGGQRGEQPRYQTAFAYDGKWQYADKTRLVIFGEYVPLRQQLPVIAKTFNMPGGDLTPGSELKTMSVGKRLVGPVICFEALFPDIAYRHAQNGAELLTVMSVDDWYIGSPAPDQLKAASIWRAVETGLPLVRSASKGYSFAVDQRGNVRAELAIGATQSFRVELPVGPANPFPLFPVFPMAALSSIALLPFGIWFAGRKKGLGGDAAGRKLI